MEALLNQERQEGLQQNEFKARLYEKASQRTYYIKVI